MLKHVFLLCVVLFALSAADDHDHDEEEHVGEHVMLAATHEVIEFCEDNCDTPVVNDTLTSTHLTELSNKLHSTVGNHSYCFSSTNLAAQYSATYNEDQAAPALKSLLMTVLAYGDDCDEATLDGSLSDYLNHSLEHVCKDDHEDHDHEEHEGDEDGEHSELEEQLEEYLTQVYDLLGLEPIKVDALNHPYDEHDHEHDEHDEEGEDEDHEEHDHDRRDEEDGEHDDEHDEHEHEDEEFECVSVESLVHAVNASSLEEGLEAAVPTLLLMVLSDKCLAPHQHGAGEYIANILLKYSHGDNSLDIEELDEMLNALMAGSAAVAVDSHEGHNHRREVECLTASALLESLGMLAPVTEEDFPMVAAAVVAMMDSGVCSAPQASASTTKPSASERYGYGLLAVTITCLASLSGAVLLFFSSNRRSNGDKPLAETRPQDLISPGLLVIMFSLAVGALVGDAILHLLPMVLGVHLHVPGEEHDHEEDYEWLWKACMAMVGIYIFVMVEVLLARFVESQEGHSHSHHHHAVGRDMEMQSSTATANSELKTRESTFGLLKDGSEATPEATIPRTTGWLVLVGDGIHNLVDGLVLGAAFSSSLTVGASTTIAVVLHELPHELGDFAILLESGWAVKRALLANFASSLTCFIGLFIGLEVSDSIDAQQWILSLAAGMFLYIALTTVMPQLIHHLVHSKAWGYDMLRFHLGFGISMMVMILLGRYEKDIDV
eukprot:m.209151 g.209151  ORF g.209151 m.209151 type:complete len:720 (+) comp17136_c0_seq2:136-2295(+)